MRTYLHVFDPDTYNKVGRQINNAATIHSQIWFRKVGTNKIYRFGSHLSTNLIVTYLLQVTYVLSLLRTCNNVFPFRVPHQRMTSLDNLVNSVESLCDSIHKNVCVKPIFQDYRQKGHPLHVHIVMNKLVHQKLLLLFHSTKLLMQSLQCARNKLDSIHHDLQQEVKLNKSSNRFHCLSGSASVRSVPFSS